VQLAADRAGELGQAALDRHVDVLVVGGEPKAARPQLALDSGQAGQQVVAVLGRDDVLGGQHARVGPGLGQVVRPQALVEAQRGVERPEGGILRQREARHRAHATARRPRAFQLPP
jgi:hypothetical protein